MFPKLDIPDQFIKVYERRKGPEGKKQYLKWIMDKRKSLEKLKVYGSEQEAKRALVRKVKDEPDDLSAIFKQPNDIGNGFVIVPHELRENAYVSGYKETVDAGRIYDEAKRYNEITEE